MFKSDQQEFCKHLQTLFAKFCADTCEFAEVYSAWNVNVKLFYIPIELYVFNEDDETKFWEKYLLHCIISGTGL